MSGFYFLDILIQMCYYINIVLLPHHKKCLNEKSIYLFNDHNVLNFLRS